MIESIGELSNVCRNLRSELGLLFWTKNFLECRADLSMKAIQAFLDDRPVAVSRIRHLKLNVTGGYKGPCANEQELITYRNMSKVFKLDTLVLELDINDVR